MPISHYPTGSDFGPSIGGGAGGYITNDDATVELAEAVHAIARGSTYFQALGLVGTSRHGHRCALRWRGTSHDVFHRK